MRIDEFGWIGPTRWDFLALAGACAVATLPWVGLGVLVGYWIWG